MSHNSSFSTSNFEALTSLSPIQADIRLDSSATPDSTGATNRTSFEVVATTTNAPLSAIVSQQPHDAHIRAAFMTQNAPARVTLQPAFEGRFELRSSVFTPPSVRLSHAQPGDPAGMGRTRRVLQQRRGSGTVVGSAVWEPMMYWDGREGQVTVQTSNAPLQLSL